MHYYINRNVKKKQLRNARPRLLRYQNKKENTRRNACSQTMNKLHHQHHHPTQPQLQPHLPTQQLQPPTVHHHLPTPHHNLATQPLNLPQLLRTPPLNLHTSQVINPQDKVVSIKVDSMVKISETNSNIVNSKI